jgi:predicted nucleic acid-binding protein
MTDLFADTAGWASWLGRREPFHALAVTVVNQARRAGRKLVTTNYILTELVAVLTSPIHLPRPQQIQLLAALRAASWVEIVQVDAALDAAAWSLWHSRPDKEWSLVDCASFVVMQQRGLAEALTTDHHFEQAGFVRLLK